MGKVIPKLLFVTIAFIIFSFVPSAFSGTKKDNKQADIYRDKGFEAQRLGNLDMALGYYQRAIEANPYNAVVYNDMGVVLEAKGKTREAKEAYLRAVSLDPNYLSAYYNLAALYEKEGNSDKAVYYWRMRVDLGKWSDVWTWRALEHLENLGVSDDFVFNSATDPKRQAEYLLSRSRKYIATGNYVTALRELNKAIILDPQNREIEQLIEDTQLKVLLYK